MTHVSDGDAVVIVQARTTSTRLPRKVLHPIGERPMVMHVLERAARIGPPVVLATSTDASDDELVELVEREGVRIHRGSLDDVLDRFVGAIPPPARYAVRVTADCPLFDPDVGRAILDACRSGRVDLVCNTLVPTFPDGLDCWAVTVEAIRRASREATLSSDREHVMPYIWRQPHLFRVWNVAHAPDLSRERWTVDDERDLAFVRGVHERTAGLPDDERLSMHAVLRVLDSHPELRALNAGTERDEGYRRSLAADAVRPAP